FTALEKPAIYPPPATFGIVWSILYFMMGIAAALVCAAWGARGRTLALALFAMQLVLNLAWSPMFFREHQIELALYLLLAIDVAVLLTLIMFFVVRRLAGLLLVPYFAWVAFATVLNYQFWLLNPQAQDVEVTSPSQRIEL
ncbi:MAG TPA: TspO/MBR family protein, partial [Sphingomonadaceae bacterium]|nr:TspO/MBR family protein [Sphingomonadaceae bacterium]